MRRPLSWRVCADPGVVVHDRSWVPWHVQRGRRARGLPKLPVVRPGAGRAGRKVPSRKAVGRGEDAMSLTGVYIGRDVEVVIPVTRAMSSSRTVDNSAGRHARTHT